MMLMMIAIGVLAVWRLTYLFHAEDGPRGVTARFRRRVGTGWLGGILDCFYCLSLWIALPVTLLLGLSPWETLVAWPALSGGAILLQRATEPLPVYREHSSEDSIDVLLRKDA
jgi:hypothetical protein